MKALFDILLATIFALSVSVLPAYLVRYKLLKRPLGKVFAVLFVFVGYILVFLAIAIHAELSHSNVLTRPGKLFALALIFWMWSILRSEKSRTEMIGDQDDSYDHTSDLQGKCPECGENYSVWKNSLIKGKCPGCDHQVVPPNYRP